MKTIKHLHKMTSRLCIAVSLLLMASHATAQNNLPDSAFPMLITPQKQSISYRERTLCLDVAANVDFQYSSNADWATLRKGADGALYLDVTANYAGEERVANIDFTCSEHENLNRTFVLTQGRNQSMEDLPVDLQIIPSSASDNNHQSSAGISLTIDGDLSTMYHSAWSGNEVTESNPAVLRYNFENVEKIDYLIYSPRTDGNANGNFGKVEVYTKLKGETSYTLYETFDWKESGSSKKVTFEGGLKDPVSIQFKVLSGYANFASCAEMQFFVKNTDGEHLFDIFADEVYSELKPGTTQKDIDNTEDLFVKSLAQQLFDGTYDKNYRVAEYECLLSPNTLSNLWNAPGKLYDQIQGVTGINITKGKHAVIAAGIPDEITVQLKVVAWYVGKVGHDFDGGNPNTTTYTLQNGVNIIDYNYAYDGLAYICYYADEEPEKYGNIKVHFVNGQTNGYLSLDKTNDEMYDLCANAKNICMDVVGSKVHSIWTSDGLKRYCKARDGVSLGYRQYMNVLDSLVHWEHRLLGLEKYNRLPKNKTMAYVNYTYYMFQGGFGVSFHQDQESRVLNCRTLIERDDDAIWGLSHEWGHQHQMHPYFCWAAQGEVSNNLFSYYNIMHMGYRTSDKIRNWEPARQHMLDDYEFSSGTKTSGVRRAMYLNANEYSYCEDLKALCLEMKDSTITAYADNPLRAVSQLEIGDGEKLCPYIMLLNYFTNNGKPDFGPDLYEALRQTDDENGSNVEKKDGVDKYELIASAQNSNKNGKLSVLREKYPTSSWVTKGYITESKCNWQLNSAPAILNFIRKCSRISGYDLTPYFEKWGFIRVIAAQIGDYGTKNYLLTQSMYDEFVADMNALVSNGTLKAMPEGMVEEISNSPEDFQTRPEFPN